MTDFNKEWDALNAEFKAKREALLSELKALDVWYQKQFELLDLPQDRSL